MFTPIYKVTLIDEVKKMDSFLCFISSYTRSPENKIGIEFRIPCKDEAEVKVLNNWLRTTDFTTSPLQFFASIPIKVKKGLYMCTTDLHGVAFMNAYTEKSK